MLRVQRVVRARNVIIEANANGHVPVWIGPAAALIDRIANGVKAEGERVAGKVGRLGGCTYADLKTQTAAAPPILPLAGHGVVKGALLADDQRIARSVADILEPDLGIRAQYSRAAELAHVGAGEISYFVVTRNQPIRGPRNSNIAGGRQ